MRRFLTSALAVASASMLMAGCAGGSSTTVATTAATTSAHAGALAFARCMRARGFPNWPDPTSDGRFDKSTLRQLGYSASRVRAVGGGACKNLLPTGSGQQETAQERRTRIADALSFARCIRSHGVRTFPDPNSDGDLSVEMVQAQGIDVHSPAVQQVVYACLPASHGALTRAKVRAAIANASR